MFIKINRCSAVLHVCGVVLSVLYFFLVGIYPSSYSKLIHKGSDPLGFTQEKYPPLSMPE